MNLRRNAAQSESPARYSTTERRWLRKSPRSGWVLRSPREPKVPQRDRLSLDTRGGKRVLGVLVPA
jgi:hypothetical protein